jgi:hypothetical protein
MSLWLVEKSQRDANEYTLLSEIPIIFLIFYSKLKI